jgi:starvation-inducible DNA-binding protein
LKLFRFSIDETRVRRQYGIEFATKDGGLKTLASLSERPTSNVKPVLLRARHAALGFARWKFKRSLDRLDEEFCTLTTRLNLGEKIMSVAIKDDKKNYVSPATPVLEESDRPIQAFGHVVAMPLALNEKIRQESVGNLNQLLADSMTLRDMYKKHHWQVSGPHFYQLHLLFDKHYEEQGEIVDTLAERIMTLGGVALAMAADVAETTTIPRPPRDRETPAVQISRLLKAHEITLQAARSMAKQAASSGDDGTNDMLVGDVIRQNELQVWFLAEHLVAEEHMGKRKP